MSGPDKISSTVCRHASVYVYINSRATAATRGVAYTQEAGDVLAGGDACGPSPSAPGPESDELSTNTFSWEASLAKCLRELWICGDDQARMASRSGPILFS